MQYLYVGITVLFLISFLSRKSTGHEVDLGNAAYIFRISRDPRYQERQLPLNIGIIGGGIGGTSSSYFLRQLFGKNVSIDIYEPDHLCGRVASIGVGDRLYEGGASILHPKNLYAKFVSNVFGLKERQSLDGYTAFFDGEDYFLQTSEWSIITLLKMIWSFGLDFFKLSWLESSFINQFVSIYDVQNSGQSFTSVKDLLNAIGPDDFVNATTISSRTFFTNNGLGDSIISVLVDGGLRSNYGQTSTVNGFVGMVSMAGIQPNLWSVDGGNKLLCTKLFRNSSASLLTQNATKITKSESGKFVIQTTTNQGEKRLYDIVIVAVPINRDKANIDVSDVFTGEGPCPSATTDPRHYQRTVATFVKGRLNSTLFKCNSLSSCPSNIFTTKDLFYRSIGLHSPVNFDPGKGDTIQDSVYKVFSSGLLTDEQLSYLFESRIEKSEVSWRAYPYYRPPDRLDTFVLNKEGVYYTSPIEWAASAVEMSMISAKNAALLAFNNWYGFEENVAGQAQARRLNSEL